MPSQKDSNMYNNNLAYSTYAQNNVSVESPQKLIAMMYEGILRFNVQAKRAINDNDIEKRAYWINRSCAVFAELINCLDFSQGEIAGYLNGLYGYQLQQLAEASMDNDASKLDAVNLVVKGLLEAWKESTDVAN